MLHGAKLDKPQTLRGGRFSEGFLLFILMIAVRAAVLAGLTLLTHGHEFTSDAVMHLANAAHPLRILTGNAPGEDGAYPPLLPFVLTVFITPFLHVLGPFLALRVGLILIELTSWPMIWLLLWRYVPDVKIRRWLALAMIVGPVGWMPSTVMAQEDIISLPIAAAVALLILSNRMEWAAFFCGLGVVCVKIFFLVPLLAVCAAPGAFSFVEFIRRSIAGAIPIVPAYAITVFSWWRYHLGNPLLDFHPLIQSTQSIWLLIYDWTGMSSESIRKISALLAFAASVFPLIVIKWRGDRCMPAEVLRLSGLMTMLVLTIFYMTMAEYLLVFLPAVLLSLNWRLAVATVVFVLPMPWAENFFYGVWWAKLNGSTASGSVFIRLYDVVFRGISANFMKHFSLSVYVISSFAIAAWLAVQVLRRAPVPIAPSAI